MSKSGRLTPMLAQYMEIKKDHPDTLLLFRMGDFFETFFDDASILAETCHVTLTTRDRNSDHPVPLAGVPHHAIDTYLKKLLDAGITVAICEQVEDPARAKGLVKRAVVDILSPGTVISEDLVDQTAGNYCLAFQPASGAESGWAILDASTGEFRCGLEDVDLPTLCGRHAVREVILPETLDGEALTRWRAALPRLVLNTVAASWFHPSFARDTLMEHFGTRDLDPFALERPDRVPSVCAAGALLRYLRSLNMDRRPAQIDALVFAERGTRMLMDEETLGNLEIFRTFRGETGEGTLLHHLDATITPMGRRLLIRRLAEPLLDLQRLDLWHRGVAGAVGDRAWREEVRATLRGIGDIERLPVRCAAGRIGPAQLRLLGTSLAAAASLSGEILDETRSGHPAVEFLRGLPDLRPLADRVTSTLADEPPARFKTGEVIRRGVDPDLDAYADVTRDTRGFLADLQGAERDRTGIPSLKVGYNKVFGYYFEVTNKHLDKVPESYQQKQTLVNACRFHTSELKEAETRILDAEQKIQDLEQRIYTTLVETVAGSLEAIQAWARMVASVDLMFAFAEIAERRDYCRPVCDDSLDLEIIGGRHPVVECLLDHDFIPNDSVLDLETRQILLLTGPNMGGKSTYLRQTALITLMAQAGSFVPAGRARIGIADRIFTRVGASDNVARGMSTFYAEMSETARILHQMTGRSLVILDEVGRGTSTYDGLSLAWAITEFLHRDDTPRPRTIFATHYHELTELATMLPRLVNLRMDVKEWEGRIVFLHAIKPGASDKSYGIHVARLAGVPEAVLRRAEALLGGLTRDGQRPDAMPTEQGPGFDIAADGPATGSGQMSLFSDAEREVLDALRDLDLERISPVDAFLWLARIRARLED